MKIKKILIFSLLSSLTVSSLFAFSDSELQLMMLNNNVEIQKAKEDVKLAHLDYKDANANFQPNVDLTMTGTYMVDPPIGRITIDSDDLASQITGISGLGNGPITLYKGMDNTLFDFNLKITQPIFTWGKLTRAVSIYDKVELVKTLQLSSMQHQLSSELKAREAGIYYLKEMKSNLNKQKEISSRLVEICADAKNQGILLEQDVLEARVKAQKVDMGLKQLDMELNNQLVALWNLTGDDSLVANDIEFIPDEEAMESLVKSDWNQLLKESISPLRETFSMLNLLKNVSSEAKEISENSIYWKPDFAIQVDLGYMGSYAPIISQDYYRQDKGRLNFTVALKGTVWDGGKKLNEISRKTIEEEKTSLKEKDAKQQICKTLNDNLLKMDYSTSKINYNKLSYKVSSLKVDQLQKTINEGYGEEKDLLLEKIDMYGFELEELKERVDRASSFYTVQFLIGK